MENKDRIINWIGISLSEAPNSLTVSYYFDYENYIFFSIHVVDYFMLNEDLEIDSSVTNISYSEKNQREIVYWIKRLDKNDNSIISVPQKGLTDDKLREIEAIEFIKKNKIDTDKATLWKIESESSISFDLREDEENNKPLNKKWWEFWK